MRKVRATLLVASVVVSVGAAGPAAAIPLIGQQLSARIVNAEFRGYTRTNRGFENQIWHFLPDGRIRAVADSRRLVWRDRDDHREWQDIGAWRLEGDRVCVSFAGPNRTIAGCYVVDAGPGKQVRLVGPSVWDGTLESYE